MCNEWSDFKNFYKDMAASYQESLQLDRSDNDGNYCKENCRWVTPKENSRNKRGLRRIEMFDQVHLLIEWSEILKIKEGSLRQWALYLDDSGIEQKVLRALTVQ